jgi:hypothetical protein
LRGSVVHGYDYNYDGGSFSDSCMRRMDGGPGVSVLNEAGANRLPLPCARRQSRPTLADGQGRPVPRPCRRRSAGHSPRAGRRRGGPGNAGPATALSAGARAGSITDRTFEIAFLDAGVGVRLHLRLATGSAPSAAGTRSFPVTVSMRLVGTGLWVAVVATKRRFGSEGSIDGSIGSSVGAPTLT